MKTQYYTATSLDGFLATEDDSLDRLFPLGELNDSNRLTCAGLGSSGPYPEDWGWLLEVTREARRFVISCGNMPHSKTSWEVWVEPAPGLLQKLLRRQDVGGVLGVCHMLHEALSAEEGVRDIDWFKVDRRGRDWDHSPRLS